ncbi:hypothetical protein M747DRAFT_270753 [Aspergillus niger ATCC 13496]|uniref:Uncharacterized protein n=3 Tax=Aspergillus niger TaxID=5061 RepID=A2QSP7_ASPNC|nr:hypothetical protein An08g11490 [Aspergillus niger]RDH14120.1 hypothetical protein M747DRAFT_270753 [Aspergillus niger ATCC 13496]CAK45819.1 hypothetical protein An08g11490 [Aspergillus niger]
MPCSGIEEADHLLGFGRSSRAVPRVQNAMHDSRARGYTVPSLEGVDDLPPNTVALQVESSSSSVFTACLAFTSLSHPEKDPLRRNLQSRQERYARMIRNNMPLSNYSRVSPDIDCSVDYQSIGCPFREHYLVAFAFLAAECVGVLMRAAKKCGLWCPEAHIVLHATTICTCGKVISQRVSGL